jgi:dTDP-4-amino-4,6-dideoxygalactose transaminase
MALKAFGIGPGDEVIVTPRSFMASASCVVTCGARPVFTDVDRDSGNITAETIARVLSPHTRAVIPVHLAGWPCEMDAIMQLARARNLWVIEDCAQAHGATYMGRQVGALGHVGSFSFCQDKIITTGGEGGLLTTNDPELWSKLWALKDHGKSYDACFNRQWPPGFRWLHESLGSNYRMTEMQAAIGRVALRKLSDWLERRRRNATILSECLQQHDCIRDPKPPAHVQHARYKHYCYVRPQVLRNGWSRDRIMSEISARGVPCFSGSCSEIYLEKAFETNGLRPASRLPVAKELGETSLAFLVHPTLTDSDIDGMCETIAKVMNEACR